MGNVIFWLVILIFVFIFFVYLSKVLSVTGAKKKARAALAGQELSKPELDKVLGILSTGNDRESARLYDQLCAKYDI